MGGDMDMVGYGHPKYGLVSSKQYQPFVDPMGFWDVYQGVHHPIFWLVTSPCLPHFDPVHWLIESQLIGGGEPRTIQAPFVPVLAKTFSLQAHDIGMALVPCLV